MGKPRLARGEDDIVDLERYARETLGFETDIGPRFNNTWEAIVMSGSGLQIAYAISDDGKTVAGTGDGDPWVLHDPSGFKSEYLPLSLDSNGDDWRDGDNDGFTFCEKLAADMQARKPGISPRVIHEALNAYYPDHSPRHPDTNALRKIKIRDALDQIASAFLPTAIVKVEFRDEEIQGLRRQLVREIYYSQDQYGKGYTKPLFSTLRAIDERKWPCAPPLEDMNALQKWTYLAHAGKDNQGKELFAAWAQGEGGVLSMSLRMKLRAGLDKAHSGAGPGRWKDWGYMEESEYEKWRSGQSAIMPPEVKIQKDWFE